MKTFEEYNLLWLTLAFVKSKANKEHSFLYKYFDKSPHKEAMEYFYVMGENYIYLFTDHTGYKANASFLSKQFYKFKSLMSIYNKAKQEIDLETLRKLDQGKIKPRHFKEINADKI